MKTGSLILLLLPGVGKRKKLRRWEDCRKQELSGNSSTVPRIDIEIALTEEAATIGNGHVPSSSNSGSCSPPTELEMVENMFLFPKRTGSLVAGDRAQILHSLRTQEVPYDESNGLRPWKDDC